MLYSLYVVRLHSWEMESNIWPIPFSDVIILLSIKYSTLDGKVFALVRNMAMISWLFGGINCVTWLCSGNLNWGQDCYANKKTLPRRSFQPLLSSQIDCSIARVCIAMLVDSRNSVGCLCSCSHMLTSLNFHNSRLRSKQKLNCVLPKPFMSIYFYFEDGGGFSAILGVILSIF